MSQPQGKSKQVKVVRSEVPKLNLPKGHSFVQLMDANRAAKMPKAPPLVVPKGKQKK